MSFADQDIVQVVEGMGALAIRTNRLARSVDQVVFGPGHSTRRSEELQALDNRCAVSKIHLEEAIHYAVLLKETGSVPGLEIVLRVDHYVSTAKYLLELSTSNRDWTDTHAKRDLELLKMFATDLYEQFDAIRRELGNCVTAHPTGVASVGSVKFRERSAAALGWKRMV